NPASTVDKKLASPRVHALIKTAQVETEATGTLRVDVEPEGATFAVDGGQSRPTTDKAQLPVGVHLITITAPGRAPYAELFELSAVQPYKISISLEEETTADQAARLVDATVSAPPGKARLKRAKALSKLTGVNRVLVVEDGAEDHVSVRVYDITKHKVSKTI